MKATELKKKLEDSFQQFVLAAMVRTEEEQLLACGAKCAVKLDNWHLATVVRVVRVTNSPVIYHVQFHEDNVDTQRAYPQNRIHRILPPGARCMVKIEDSKKNEEHGGTVVGFQKSPVLYRVRFDKFRIKEQDDILPSQIRRPTARPLHNNLSMHAAEMKHAATSLLDIVHEMKLSLVTSSLSMDQLSLKAFKSTASKSTFEAQLAASEQRLNDLTHKVWSAASVGKESV